MIAHPGVDWVGCTNELNAGYAADGYARLRGMGGLMTTFGVGELTAINAIAGGFAEHVPVVHCVGAPSTRTQTAQRIVHHSLGDGVFTHCLRMHEDITCARSVLTAADAATEIDRVLIAVRDRKLPGYLLLPSDVAEASAPRSGAPLPASVDLTDPAALTAFTQAAAGLLSQAPDRAALSILAGVLVHRFDAVAELTELSRMAVPHATISTAASSPSASLGPARSNWAPPPPAWVSPPSGRSRFGLRSAHWPGSSPACLAAMTRSRHRKPSWLSSTQSSRSVSAPCGNK